MINRIKKILGITESEQAKALKDTVIEERKKDLRDLKKINKQIQLIAENGSVEITIRNLDGVIKELNKT